MHRTTRASPQAYGEWEEEEEGGRAFIHSEEGDEKMLFLTNGFINEEGGDRREEMFGKCVFLWNVYFIDKQLHPLAHTSPTCLVPKVQSSKLLQHL